MATAHGARQKMTNCGPAKNLWLGSHELQNARFDFFEKF